MEFLPLGDSALLVRLTGARPGRADEVLDKVLALREKIVNAEIQGVQECTSSYASVAVYYDAAAVAEAAGKSADPFNWLSEQVRALGRGSKGKHKTSRETVFGFCVDAEFAPDLARVAEQADLSPAKVIEIFCRAEFRVAAIGFTPGFPYLTGLPEKLATPRLATPRQRVPAGSVGIGGMQAGVYPLSSPGGWNLIGRTAKKLFDPQSDRPSLLQPGDKVRFQEISRAEFEAGSA